MKGLYYNGTAAEYREDLPMPVPEPGESLIKNSLQCRMQYR